MFGYRNLVVFLKFNPSSCWFFTIIIIINYDFFLNPRFYLGFTLYYFNWNVINRRVSNLIPICVDFLLF